MVTPPGPVVQHVPSTSPVSFCLRRQQILISPFTLDDGVHRTDTKYTSGRIMMRVAAHRRQYPSLRSSPCRLPLRIRGQNRISKRIAMTVEIAQPTVVIVYLSEYRVPSCATYITDPFCQLCVQVHPTWKDRPLPAQSCPCKYPQCQGSGFPGRALQGLQPSNSLGAERPPDSHEPRPDTNAVSAGRGWVVYPARYPLRSRFASLFDALITL